MTHNAVRGFEFWALQYRRNWLGTAVSGVLSPIIYLAAMGLGLSKLVDEHVQPASLDGVRYLVYLTPGLMAWTSFQTAIGESAYPVLGGIIWRQTYRTMVASPLLPRDILIGHLSWIALRLAMVSGAFFAVAAIFGSVTTAGAILAWPAAVLVGVATAAPIMAFAVRQTSSAAFDVVFRVLVTPLFLFSGTFFPISRMPVWLQPIAWVTPLWHGVQLCRAAMYQHESVPTLATHICYLVVLALVGVVLALRSYRTVLST